MHVVCLNVEMRVMLLRSVFLLMGASADGRNASWHLLDLNRAAVLAVSFPLSGPWWQTFRGDLQVQLPGLMSGDPGEVGKGDVWIVIVACRRPG